VLPTNANSFGLVKHFDARARSNIDLNQFMLIIN